MARRWPRTLRPPRRAAKAAADPASRGPGRDSRPKPRGRAAWSRSSLLLDLLGEIVALAGLRDEHELGLDPVGVLFLALEDRRQELAGAVVAEAAGDLDGGIEGLDGRLLHLEIEAELLGHRLADVHLAEPLEIGHAFQIEEAGDEAIGVPHLPERLLADLLPQPDVAPVLAHPCVDPVLVDGRELGGEDLVQERDDLVVAP